MKKAWESRSYELLPHYTPATSRGYCCTELQFWQICC